MTKPTTLLAIAFVSAASQGCAERPDVVEAGQAELAVDAPDDVDAAAAGLPSKDRYADSHFHPSNYVMQGGSLGEILTYMASDVVRSTIMPIPLHQKWDYFEHFAADAIAPTYYIGPRAQLQYYSFVDAMVAREYNKLPPNDRLRFDPMITAFNPMDLYAVNHIKRVLLTSPGVFDGIGEFTVHKEVVSDKLADEPVAATAGGQTPPDATGGERVTLYNPSVVNILNFTAESGLVVVLHNDIYDADVRYDGTVLELSPNETHVAGLKALCNASPDANVIWAHTGLGRFVSPSPNHLELVADVLQSCPNWSVDISWDLVQAYILSPLPSQPTFASWVQFLHQFQDRVLFGSDNVFFKRTTIDANGVITPGRRQNLQEYLAVQLGYKPLWDELGPAVAHKIKLGNYRRIFDEARVRVRAWEAEHEDDDIWDLPAIP